jgi:hypothetical protein
MSAGEPPVHENSMGHATWPLGLDATRGVKGAAAGGALDEQLETARAITTSEGSLTPV